MHVAKSCAAFGRYVKACQMHNPKLELFALFEDGGLDNSSKKGNNFYRVGILGAKDPDTDISPLLYIVKRNSLRYKECVWLLTQEGLRHIVIFSAADKGGTYYKPEPGLGGTWLIPAHGAALTPFDAIYLLCKDPSVAHVGKAFSPLCSMRGCAQVSPKKTGLCGTHADVFCRRNTNYQVNMASLAAEVAARAHTTKPHRHAPYTKPVRNAPAMH